MTGWIGDVVPNELISSTNWGNRIRDQVVQVFESNADRNANAHPRVGMFAWSELDFELACYGGADPGWMVLIQKWQAWTPDVMMGAAHLPVLTDHGTGYRRSFQTVEVRCQVDVGNYLAADPADILTVVPPFIPFGTGDFGIMTVAREGVGWKGPVGAYDPSRLACIKIGIDFGTAALVSWADLVDGTGSFTTVTLSGSYETADYSSGP